MPDWMIDIVRARVFTVKTKASTPARQVRCTPPATGPAAPLTVPNRWKTYAKVHSGDTNKRDRPNCLNPPAPSSTLQRSHSSTRSCFISHVPPLSPPNISLSMSQFLSLSLTHSLSHYTAATLRAVETEVDDDTSVPLVGRLPPRRLSGRSVAGPEMGNARSSSSITPLLCRSSSESSRLSACVTVAPRDGTGFQGFRV